MIRTLSTAAVAVIFAGALTGAASAHAHPRAHNVSAVESVPPATGSAAADSVSSLTQAPDAGNAAQQPFIVAPATRAQLRKLEVASMMPQDGDLAMWGTPTAPKPAHVAKASQHEKKTGELRRFASGIISRTSSIAMSLTRSAMRFIGTPYVFGGTSPGGFDCSGYTQHVFAMLGISLPRTADAQYYAGHPITGGLTTGDLVFFQTYEPGPSHVGIYIGNGRFIHSSSHGVMISPLAQSYWASRYLGAKRVANLR